VSQSLKHAVRCLQEDVLVTYTGNVFHVYQIIIDLHHSRQPSLDILLFLAMSSLGAFKR